MKKLRVSLRNCYGIKRLDHEFDFGSSSAYAVYAPNGMMKSSMARAFMDVSAGSVSQDRVFPTRPCTRSIADESGVQIPKESVLVVLPYSETYAHSERTSVLLVDAKLRTEYEQLHVEIDKAKALLLAELKKHSKSKQDIEREVSTTFTSGPDEFLTALVRVREELAAQTDMPFADVPYDRVFDDKVLAFLGTKDFRTAIRDYIKRYNDLLAASTYFKRGIFNYYNAATIAKSLADNGFFDAHHTVSLNALDKTEISTAKQLEELIQKEKDSIAADAELKKKFADIEKQITKNANLRAFEEYLQGRADILPELENIGRFKEKLWKSYLKASSSAYDDLVAKYLTTEKRKKEIEQEALKQRTQWEEVISIFNERFIVPFKLTAENKIAVMLGQEPLLTLGFTFDDGAERASLQRGQLLEVLSTGEKKAFYLLNIIFEIEARKKTKQPTILILDDIADSFDYKNKYAIVEYLKEIADIPSFHQLILTHNFDFFRTIESRGIVPYANCLIANRDGNGVSLSAAVGIRNVFVNDWKPSFHVNARKKIASVPFIRNLVEYTKGADAPEYAQLTSLLHWKSDSPKITVGDLDRIYATTFGSSSTSQGSQEKVMDLILREAQACVGEAEGAAFESKIVLAIATRVSAERYMVGRINDPTFVSGLRSNQTAKLFGRFRKDFATEADGLRVLHRVVLMTPESIHLNSFMYEPIIDMSEDHLKVRFRRVLGLK